jgi:hypothetical protein
MNLWFKVWLAALFLLPLEAALSQEPEQESVQMGLIRVIRPTAFRKAPSTAANSWLVLRPGVQLNWIEGQQVNGFLRAVGLFGPYGWVSSADVQVRRPGPTFLRGGAKTPCQPNLAACDQTYGLANSSTRGCANVAHEPQQALANELKHGSFSGGAVVDLSFSDFAVLQSQAERLVGQGHLPPSRAPLVNLSVAAGSVNERSDVRVSGFIAAGPLGPHPNTGESVNCNLPAPVENDFHINITAGPGQQEFGGFVIEMIPQNRSYGWSLQKLESIRSSQRRIMVVGPLFYDSFHVVNDNPQAPLPGQPKRFSLWEVHPIGLFFVCTRPTNDCNPNAPNDWVTLENLTP